MKQGKGKKLRSGSKSSSQKNNTKKPEDLYSSDSKEIDNISKDENFFPESDVEIEQLTIFEKSYEKLRKKYIHIADDINPIIQRFLESDFPGVRDDDFTYPVYKVRFQIETAKVVEVVDIG